jgi:hypothetical protein
MMSIFSDMIEKIMEVFMDDFTVYGKTLTVRRKAISLELREMLFYGLGRYSARTQGVRPWDRGGQSKN